MCSVRQVLPFNLQVRVPVGLPNLFDINNSISKNKLEMFDGTFFLF